MLPVPALSGLSAQLRGGWRPRERGFPGGMADVSAAAETPAAGGPRLDEFTPLSAALLPELWVVGPPLAVVLPGLFGALPPVPPGGL